MMLVLGVTTEDGTGQMRMRVFVRVEREECAQLFDHYFFLLIVGVQVRPSVSQTRCPYN